jgi:hypothetical protein
MNTDFQRKGAKTQSRREDGFSLTPRFSRVSNAGEIDKPFQRFIRAASKPLKRFVQLCGINTRLKPGVNERRVAEVVKDIWTTEGDLR